MTDDQTTTSLQLRDGGFNEIAQTVLRAVNEVAVGVNRIAADSILQSVKEAYLKGYNDGYREAMRRLYEQRVAPEAVGQAVRQPPSTTHHADE